MKKEYLQLMLDSLQKKKQALKDLTDKTMKQQMVLSEEEVEWDQFNAFISEKEPLIHELITLDQGFAAVFEKIKDDLMKEKDKYKTEIAVMQQEIKEISEIGSKLEVLEHRNRKLVQDKIAAERRNIKQSKMSSKAVMEYYQRMNKINTIDPQLMDKKS